MTQKLRFISFEGIEGCGKSTQAKKLYEYFLSNQSDCLLTREPGGCISAEKIREILLDEKIDKLNPKSELLLNFVSRLQHVENVIKPALAQKKIVISDRFFDSTYAYQGSALGIDFSLIDEVKKLTIGDFTPDITFLIDLPVEIAFKRIEGRAGNNRYEKLGLDFHQKVRDGFLGLAKKNPRIKIINGTESQQQIFQQILDTLGF